ncbi:hypothetical protein D018_0950A, partial [Vibrio parahaemolyticus VP2007-007]
MKLACSVL